MLMYFILTYLVHILELILQTQTNPTTTQPYNSCLGMVHVYTHMLSYCQTFVFVQLYLCSCFVMCYAISFTSAICKCLCFICIHIFRSVLKIFFFFSKIYQHVCRFILLLYTSFSVK